MLTSLGVIVVNLISNGSPIPVGYVASQPDAQASYNITIWHSHKLLRSLRRDYHNTAIDLSAVNGPDAAHTFLGAVGASSGLKFKSGLLGFVVVFLPQCLSQIWTLSTNSDGSQCASL